MPKDDQNTGRFLGIGLQMLVGVGMGIVVGRWLDNKYGWQPWGVLIGSMLGLAAGMYLLIKEALRMNADPPKTKEDDSARRGSAERLEDKR